METRWKLTYLVCLGLIYFVSFWLLTVGFFTPHWINDYQDGFGFGAYQCSSVGLVSGDCRFPYGSLYIGQMMRSVMFMVMMAFILLYINTILLVGAVFFNQSENQVYMAFVAISFGVFYPIAGILVLVASIWVEVRYSWQSGYSVIISNVAGALMILFYVGLRVYDYQHIKSRGRNKGLYADISIGREKKQQTSDASHDEHLRRRGLTTLFHDSNKSTRYARHTGY